MNYANSLTLFRLILSPFFLIIYLYHDDLWIKKEVVPFILLAIFLLSELSDALDGYIARKYNQVTNMGKLIDPMADSIARISAFLSFTQPPISFPLWLVYLFFFRDTVVSTLRTICALQGFALAASKTGKIKAIIQAVVILIILVMMIPYSRGDLGEASLYFWSLLLGWGAAIYSIYSAVEYLLFNRKYLFLSLKNPSFG